MNLYIARNGKSLGPYTEAQAREYLTQGVFNPDDLAMPDGFARWRPLSEVMEALGLGRVPSRNQAQPKAKPPRSARKIFVIAGVLLAVAVGAYLLLMLSWSNEKQRCWDVVNQTFDLGESIANSDRYSAEEKLTALRELKDHRNAAWHRLEHVLETKPGFLTTDDRKELAHAKEMIVETTRPDAY